MRLTPSAPKLVAEPDASSVFGDRLAKVLKGTRRPTDWVYVHEDQLSDEVGPLARDRHLGVLLVEHRWKAGLRPSHAQRVALVWANQRQFALEMARGGRAVRYVIAGGPLREVLPIAASDLGAKSLLMMEAAEHETRADLAPVVASGLVRVVPHAGWLTTRAEFDAAHAGAKGSPRWKMDTFYRHVRKARGVLMEPDGSFVGGKVSFDSENREPWSGARGEPVPPMPPRFTPDVVTAEVVELVRRDFSHLPGRLDAGSLPSTRADADALWAWAKASCLYSFGPYEDAMSVRSTGLWHTRISALMNLHRLLPRAVVRDVERLEIPLASKEGFIRQVLGWREFVKHVHDATEGFRKGTSVAQGVGDGGHARWRSRAQEGVSGQPKERPAPGTPPGQHGWLTSATPAALGKDTPLPDAYWGQPSGMNCLDHVVKSVWAEGYSHHITRLMVLSNLATLLDVSPRELTDWFWIAYADAWDWVVEPNVLAMGTYAVGPLMTTKPYVSGAAYIDKMSDYCGSCALKPGITCPVTPMYWAFLDRHKAALDKTGRMMMPLRSLAKRSAAQRAADARVFVAVRDVLVKGQRVTPGLVERAVKEGSRA